MFYYTTNQWNPSYDVEENEKQFQLRIEAAGVPKEKLKIEVVENRLTVSGERKWRMQEDEMKFERSFTLPTNIDAAKIEANYQDGILELTLPKAEAAKPRQITIGEKPLERIAENAA